MVKDGNKVLLLFPNMQYDTPVAANIWGNNLARTFARIGLEPTILYLGKHSQMSNVTDCSVNYLSLPVFCAWSMGVPKLRTLLLPVFQRHYILRSAYKYKFIIPLEGPYTLKREVLKREWIDKAHSKYFFTILEHPKRNAAAKNASDYKSYMREVANMYDVVLTITDYIRDIFVEYGRTKPTLVNPIIVDTERYDNAMKMERELPIRNLLYCGNLNHEEEMRILFREFAMVAKRYPHVRLVVIGGGRSHKQTNKLISYYRRTCRNLGVFDSVRFTGTLLHDEVINEYTYADAFLLPRPFREYSAAGFPSKLGEYLACGKPVIAYGTGDIPKYLTNMESAYLVMDESEGSFAEMVTYAIRDKNARSVGRSGAIVAGNSFSIEAATKRMAHFFRENSSLLG